MATSISSEAQKKYGLENGQSESIICSMVIKKTKEEKERMA